jgi:hypothetical protein
MVVKKSKRKMKRNRKTRKGGGLTITWDGSIEATNNTGRADALILFNLNVRCRPVAGKLPLPTFYGKPTQIVPGFDKSFKDAYLELDGRRKKNIKDLIKYACYERLADGFSHKKIGHPTDDGHAYMYAVTKMLGDYVKDLDYPTGSKEQSEEQYLRIIEIYKGEFKNILGDDVNKSKVDSDVSTAPYDRYENLPLENSAEYEYDAEFQESEGAFPTAAAAKAIGYAPLVSEEEQSRADADALVEDERRQRTEQLLAARSPDIQRRMGATKFAPRTQYKKNGEVLEDGEIDEGPFKPRK